MQVKRTIKKKAPQTSLQIAKTAAKFAADKKAEDITVLDMRDVVNFCDFFVIASGTSTRHAQAIAQGVVDDFKDLGTRINTEMAPVKRAVVPFLDCGSPIAAFGDDKVGVKVGTAPII